MTSSRPWLLTLLLAVGLTTMLSSGEAHAQAGNWTWGPPGFSEGMSPADRSAALVNNGLADPNANYWTPFWQGNGPNYYTGAPDTGTQNTFAVNHDINSTYGIPLIGYLDIFTPLFGTNELAIATAIGQLWDSIVDTVSQVWDSLTSIFQGDFNDYSSSGSYDYGGGFDNGYSDFGDDGWGGGGGGGPPEYDDEY